MFQHHSRSKSFRWIPVLIALALALGLVLASAPPPPAHALPIPTLYVTVNTLTQNAADGQCDLWEALQAVFQANFGLSPTYHECTAAIGPNVIAFGGAAAGSTITLGATEDLPFVWGDTTILGPDVINGSGPTSDHHIFRLAGGANLQLIGVTVKDSHTGGAGAAIFVNNGATVNLIGSSVTGNTSDDDGGAIYSNGDVNVTLSNFSGNQAGVNGGPGNGGAISIIGSGTLNVQQSNFAGNLAASGGGAIFAGSAQAFVADSVFNGNITNLITPTNSGGGAVYFAGTQASLARTAFSGNLSPNGWGGAVYAAINATVLITDTSFNANLAGTPTQSEMAGAIYSQANLNVWRSAFINNIAVQGDGGALVVDKGSTATIANTSFMANTAPLGFGGAIVVTNTQAGGPASSLIAKNVTLWTNAAKPPSDHGGGIFVGPGHSASVGNTIFDGNISGNCTGTVTSLGHNLDSGTGCNLTQTGDIQNGSANLDTPGFNGGPITSLLTQKLLSGSDAIDAGDNAVCNAAPVNKEDQRGDVRPKDGDANGSAVCDIGAYESDTMKPGYGSAPVQPGPINVGNTTFGTLITTTFTVINTGNAQLTLSNPILAGTNAGDFSVITTFSTNLGAAASKSIVIGCNPAGPAPGTRTATLAFTTNDPLFPAVLYNLTCNASAVPAAGFGSSPIAPGPIGFPDAILGGSSQAVINIQETGNAQLNVSAVIFGGPEAADFSVVTALPILINDGGASKSLTLKCTPGAVGVRTGTATLTTNDPNHSTGVTFNLTCTGIPVPPPYLVTSTSIGNSPDHGLDGVYGVVVSPDGKNVYASSYLAGSVSVFTRSLSSGNLTFFGQRFAIFGQLDGARLIAMSPDGKNAYVSANTNGTVIQLNRDSATGDLSAVHGNSRADLVGAYGVAVSPDGRFVYATGNTSGSVVVFSRNVTSGDLTYVQSIVTAELAGARGLTVSPDGANLYVTAYGTTTTGNLVIYKRNSSDGTLTHVQTRSQGDCIDFWLCFFGGTGLDGLKGAFQVVVSPDNADVYAIGTYSGAIVSFRRNVTDGSLAWNGAAFDSVNGTSGVTISPDGTHVVTSNYNDKSVSVFWREPTTGLLTYLEKHQRTPLSGVGGNPPLDGAREVTFSSDGKDVYAAAYIDDSVAHLSQANPVPSIDSLSPASAQQGSAAFTLLVTGNDFMSNSVVVWNGSVRTTTYVNSHQLTASISAVDINSAGSKTVTVYNYGPGGGYSNAVNFTVTTPGNNPVPSLDHLSPAGVMAGSAGFWLDVYGSNFTAASTGVEWNGVLQLTAYVDSTHLRFLVPISFVAQPGTASVAVFTTSPGGGKSNVVSFDIAAPGQNPTPAISGLSPAWVFSYGAASQQFTLIVTGTNFVDGAFVQWNGANRPTKFISSTQLQATIVGADSALTGSQGISVINPAPGGGESNTLAFEVKRLYRVYLPMVVK